FTKPTFLIDFDAQFITDFQRTTWDIAFNDSTMIEVALDQGVVTAGTRIDTIQEIELELKNGNPELLKTVAKLFELELALTPESRSKAARGFALI
ncbi:MAG: inorganic triphosphatase, partial [Gammaproteobacteria bacterium]